MRVSVFFFDEERRKRGNGYIDRAVDRKPGQAEIQRVIYALPICLFIYGGKRIGKAYAAVKQRNL